VSATILRSRKHAHAACTQAASVIEFDFAARMQSGTHAFAQQRKSPINHGDSVA